MTPPRTLKDIQTASNIPQNRYLKSLNRLQSKRTPVSLKKVPYSTREPQRAPVKCEDNLTATSYRHVFKMKVVPPSVRLQIAQIKRLGLLK
ncbi:hypothetical protein PCC7418_0487 [Halothece sp. PCC 7418]|uniref:hypothetical protein n=1 Tax=Halothece sp. (strain PCC 7418) TaxID=65093 RepID=UPI0002A07068|nr:hypothetical protein [Halothece sp. PCC 7418]AFZ42716.1 hypothetical protein PCC7418_0487 [Halothece sp. PCC 7418]